MSPRRKYSRFSPRLKDGEKSALDKLRNPGETNRMLLLRLAGIEANPLPRGPRARPQMASHAIGSDGMLSDHHEIQGLELDQVFEESQRQRERKKRGMG